MNQILNALRLLPGSVKVIVPAMILLGALYFVYRQFGLVAALVILFGVLFIVAGIWFFNLLLKKKEQQDSLAFGKALGKSQAGASKQEVRSAVGDLGKKWEEAAANLRTHGKDLYTLPWFMLIGEPQSGKSTTLINSGLKFPIGQESISGGGGTRNCDWWFTDKAVILDTAGRFTFQESNATDAAEWNHFLKLLASHRPHCPVNGVLLVIPVDSLLRDNKAARQAKARNINDKLNHIQKMMSIQFPVFVLLTKSDTIYGFTEFFNKLDANQQREMLGWSNPVEDAGFDMSTFRTSFNQIIRRLDQVRLRNLSRPEYSYDANKTYIFPEELKTLAEPLQEYMSIIFEDSIYKDPLFFRGYYFTSGLQEGTPITRACGAMLRNEADIARLESVFLKSRAFFIRDFYTEKVFPEQGLVRRASHHLKKDLMKKRIVTGVNIALLLFGLLFAFFTYRHLKTQLSEPKKAIDAGLAAFEKSPEDFFTTRDRVGIYNSLDALHKGISTGKDSSFGFVLRGRKNALTKSMQDTFSFLFLDKVMEGLYRAMGEQLGGFRLNTPRGDSHTELALLNEALAELKLWRHKVKTDKVDDFEPSILPFLKLALDPEWDTELVREREIALQGTLADRFDAWFKEIHADSSTEVKRFLIEEMVRRTDGVFDDLEKDLLNFYHRQPELARYKNKLAKINELNELYAKLKNTGLSDVVYESGLQSFHSRYGDLVDDLNREGDAYLPFPVIAERTVGVLGSAFALNAEEAQPSERIVREREDLPRVYSFVRKLNAVSPDSYEDPRGQNEGEAVGMKAPTELVSFHDEITQPYFTEFVNSPNADYGSVTEMDNLFQRGAERGKILTDVFKTNARRHLQNVADARERDDMRVALEAFLKSVQDRHARDFMAALPKTIPSEDVVVPPPGSQSWEPLLREFNERKLEDRRYAFFLRGPEYLGELLIRKETELALIPVDEKALKDQIKGYERRVYENLEDFDNAFNGLNNLGVKEILERKKRGESTFPQLRDIEGLARIDIEMELLRPHLDSLAAWANAVLTGFRAYNPTPPDPCPACGGQLRELLAAYRPVANQFPVNFSGTVTTRLKERGETEFDVSLASTEALERLFSQIELFRNPDENRLKHLQKKGIDQVLTQAVAWMDGVKKLQSGGIVASYKYQQSLEDQNTILNHYTMCDLKGLYQSRRMSLASPTSREITPNPEVDIDRRETLFHLFNDAEGNDATSDIRVMGDQLALFGFILDGSRRDNSGTRFEKNMVFQLDTRDQDLRGQFLFTFSEPIAEPPDWQKIR